MAYLGRPGATAPLTTADIPDNSITAAKIVDATIAAGDLASDVVINTSGAITTTDRIGVGTATPAQLLSVAGTGGTTTTSVENYGTTAAQGAQLLLARSNNTTLGTQTAVDASDLLGEISFQGSGGTSFITGARIDAVAKETFNHAGATGTAIRFSVCNLTDNTVRERMQIAPDGKVGIGTNAPAQQFESYSTSAHRLRVSNANYGIELHQPAGNSAPHINSYGGSPTDSSLCFDIADSEKMRIKTNGNVGIGTSGPSAKLHVVGDVLASSNGVYVGAYTGENGIRTASNGGSSTTLYIGNGAIQVSSDERIKENIVDTEIDAMGKLNALRVVDFTWNDPSDTSFNNRNARGKYTGLIAQEVIDVLPFAVNAVRDEETLTPQPNAKHPAIPDILYEDGDEIPKDKSIGDVRTEGTPETDALWGMEYQYIVPVLVKAIQELSAKVTTLENA